MHVCLSQSILIVVIPCCLCAFLFHFSVPHPVTGLLSHHVHLLCVSFELVCLFTVLYCLVSWFPAFLSLMFFSMFFPVFQTWYCTWFGRTSSSEHHVCFVASLVELGSVLWLYGRIFDIMLSLWVQASPGARIGSDEVVECLMSIVPFGSMVIHLHALCGVVDECMVFEQHYIWSHAKVVCLILSWSHPLFGFVSHLVEKFIVMVLVAILSAQSHQS